MLIKIKKLKVSNFKSFKDIDIELGNLNVVIGANASGKSNFIKVFEFLKDIATNGLENAIYQQGGFDYFTNNNLKNNATFKLEIAFEYIDSPRSGISINSENSSFLHMLLKETTYSFEINLDKTKKTYKISSDKLVQKCGFCLKGEKELIYNKEEIIDEVILNITNTGEELIINPYEIPDKLKCYKNAIESLLKSISKKINKNRLILEESRFCYPIETTLNFFQNTYHPFKNISLYEIDPKKANKPIDKDKVDLEKDGRNIAFALEKILKDDENNRKFHNLVNFIIPFAEKFELERDNMGSLMFKLREQYSKDLLPSYLLSDGTVNITAMIVLLYFEQKPFIIIEEPEKNIHPHLMRDLAEMIYEAANLTKQIIVTTHSAELIRNIDLGNILFISRNKEGFSKIERLSDNKKIKNFLSNELGIDELFIENMLEL